MDVAGVGGENENAIREKHGFGDGVRDEEGGPGLELADGKELLVEMLARHLVERAERLVEQKNFRREREGACEGDAHFLSARKLAGIGLGFFREADEVEHAASRGDTLGGGGAAEFLRELDVARDGEPGEERGLLENEREIGRGGVGRAAVHGDRAFVVRREPGDQAQERGFAAAARADERNEIPGPRGEGKLVEHERTGAEALGDLTKFDDGRRRRHGAPT